MVNRTNLTLLGGAIGLSIYILATNSSTDDFKEKNIKVEEKIEKVDYIKEINSITADQDRPTNYNSSTNDENNQDQKVEIVNQTDNSSHVVRDEEYFEKQKELKDKVFNQYVQPVINPNGYPLNFTSKDKTKVATIYSNALPYNPSNSSTPPLAPSIISFSGFTAVVPSETVGETIDTIAAITDQTTGETEYIDLNKPADMPNQSNSTPEEEKSSEPIVITTPPSPGQ
jgi:hypothetical protein